MSVATKHIIIIDDSIIQCIYVYLFGLYTKHQKDASLFLFIEASKGEFLQEGGGTLHKIYSYKLFSDPCEATL